MNLTDLLDRLSYWLVLARRAALKAWRRITMPAVRYEDGCCSCGALLATWVYWGAMPGDRSEDPDWTQCDTCHDDPANAWFEGLDHMTVTEYWAGAQP